MAAPIGTGADSFQLAIGNDGETEVTEPSYLVQSTVQSGNLQLLTFDFDSARGQRHPGRLIGAHVASTSFPRPVLQHRAHF